MPSPFPGMDPHLETPSFWSGVHQRLITYIADELQPMIRPKYTARIEERVYLLQPEHTILSDLSIVRQQPDARLGSVVILDQPLVFIWPQEEIRQSYIEIVHNKSGEVVTVIEVLSPANKQGKGYVDYQKKQQELLYSEANLVEIDLLSQGNWTIAWPKNERKKLPAYRYLVCVTRKDPKFTFEIYPIKLADKLPHFAIPLRYDDADTALNLATVFNKCYDNGGYEDFIDYQALPKVTLSNEEHEQCEIRRKGTRKGRNKTKTAKDSFFRGFRLISPFSRSFSSYFALHFHCPEQAIINHAELEGAVRGQHMAINIVQIRPCSPLEKFLVRII